MLNLKSFENSDYSEKQLFSKGLECLDLANREMREVYSALYPTILSDFGLKETIEWLDENFLAPKKIKSTLEVDIPSAIAKSVEINLYRIIQELFTNIVKHSGASHVFLKLIGTDKAFSLTVRDNGIGFDIVKTDADDLGYGLSNIQQRVIDLGGSLSIENEGKHTNIEISIPVV